MGLKAYVTITSKLAAKRDLEQVLEADINVENRIAFLALIQKAQYWAVLGGCASAQSS
jgi:hypothetical protein